MRPKGAWRVEQESRPCRKCGAAAGQTCVTSGGNVDRRVHAERWNDAMAARGESFSPRPEGRTGRRRFDGVLTHGTQYAYAKKGCRCDPCRAWAAAQHKKFFADHPEKAAAAAERLLRLKQSDPEKDREVQARVKARALKLNADLAAAAIARGRHWQPWTGPELEMAARRDLTTVQIARIIGRSERSVSCMRERLSDANPRDRMLMNGPTPPTSRSGHR